ncbi:hypothetical protein [Desulfospira joergensenii]|uniref:hypothetical protein n=1 Tax=Desulfospira joergensenii TaxID=53329 RepID=UPI0004240F27|nr:hypothetical protein [Desulfospira joergensenii]
MGIETLLQSMMNLSRAQALEVPQDGNVPLPKGKADPAAADEFSRIMASDSKGLEAAADPGKEVEQPAQASMQVQEPDRLPEPQEPGYAKEWLNSVTDILGKDAISHSDLYRVQVLAELTHIEVTRNSNVTKGIDDGLKSLLKNT